MIAFAGVLAVAAGSGAVAAQEDTSDFDLADYATEEGVVETDGLREAISDWRAGEISADELRAVIEAWRSDEPVTDPGDGDKDDDGDEADGAPPGDGAPAPDLDINIRSDAIDLDGTETATLEVDVTNEGGETDTRVAISSLADADDGTQLLQSATIVDKKIATDGGFTAVVEAEIEFDQASDVTAVVGVGDDLTNPAATDELTVSLTGGAAGITDLTETQYPTVTAAVEDVEEEETIEVNNGTFEEDLTVETHNVTIFGQGEGKTVIDGNVTVESDNVTIQDLTIQGDYADNGENNELNTVDVTSSSPGGTAVLNGSGADLTDVAAETIVVDDEAAEVSGESRATVIETNTELQAAVDVAAGLDELTEDRILVNPGAYEADVTVPNGAEGVTITSVAGPTETTILPAETGFDVQANNVTIDGFTIRGASSDAIFAEDLTGTLTVTDTTIQNVGGNGIFGRNVGNVTAIDNTLEDTAAVAAINVWQGQEALVQNNDISSAGPGSGIVVEELDTAAVLRNDIVSAAGGSGVYADSIDDTVTIHDNTISDVSDEGIEGAFAIENAIVTDNTVSDVGSNGIYMVVDNTETVTGNEITSTGGDGIWLDGYTETVEVADNEIEDAGYLGLDATGGDVTVTNNDINETASGGIVLDASFNATVQRNTVTNAGGEGIGISAFDDVTIEDNFLDNIQNDNTYFYSGGIVVETTDPLTGEVTENQVQNVSNAAGVRVDDFDDGDVSGLSVTANNIVDNDDGLEADTVDELDATENWWGNDSGPSGDGSGTGDSVSGNVDFEPWLDAPFDEGGQPV